MGRRKGKSTMYTKSSVLEAVGHIAWGAHGWTGDDRRSDSKGQLAPPKPCLPCRSPKMDISQALTAFEISGRMSSCFRGVRRHHVICTCAVSVDVRFNSRTTPECRLGQVTTPRHHLVPITTTSYPSLQHYTAIVSVVSHRVVYSIDVFLSILRMLTT